MSEIKLAQQDFEQPVRGDAAANDSGIQLLTDLELALAGGGEVITPWP